MSQFDAGPFSLWLAGMRAVLRGERDADVPCGDCVGCCVSSYPIPLRVTDRVARDQVPEQLLLGPVFPASQWLMGFREDGSCPFQNAGCCDIYASRPQTCRDYDCRIYAATGLLPAGDRPIIAERVASWRFSFPQAQDRLDADAVHRAARFVQENAAFFPPGVRTDSPTAVAVLAIQTHELFRNASENEAASEADVRRKIAAMLEQRTADRIPG